MAVLRILSFIVGCVIVLLGTMTLSWAVSNSQGFTLDVCQSFFPCFDILMPYFFAIFLLITGWLSIVYAFKQDYADPLHMVHGSAKALDNFIEVMDKHSVKKCQKCKYPFANKKEQGHQYTIPKIDYKKSMTYPDDFLFICPLCKIELGIKEEDKPWNKYMRKSHRYLISKIKKWRKSNSPIE